MTLWKCLERFTAVRLPPQTLLWLTDSHVQWSLYFKTTHWTMKMWCYSTGGLKIKVLYHTNCTLGPKIDGLIINVALK